MTTIDDNKNMGLRKNGVTDSVDWVNLPDSEIICQTVYGPDTGPYQLAAVGNMRGTIFNDKIKTLNPGVWLNDEVVNFMIGLMLQDEEESRPRNPKQKSYFIFTSQFMAQLLNRGSNGMDGEYTYAKA